MGKTIFRCEPNMALARNRVDNPIYVYGTKNVSTFLKSFAKGKSYYIKTFGCQANVRDEEVMAGYLELAGFVKCQNDKPDIVIINTCAVRENAEEKVYGEIGKYKSLSITNPSFVLAVCGCMMQQENKARKIKETYPYVNIVFGTHNVSEILSLLEEHLRSRKDLVDVASFPGNVVEDLPSSRIDNKKAFVNIAYGCDKFCTYCIVPYTRGRERSRKKEDIIKECKQLVEEGYREITLLGQNVNSYGKDFKDGTSFADILDSVASLGITRLRFMTSHPWDFSPKMLDVIASHKNIMKCIHLPVQSGSSEMLRRMGRRYNREDYLSLVKTIREKIPGCAITTDIIVGFPNETEEEFNDTLSLVVEVKYDAAFTFIYSPRQGTPAALIKDNVSDEDKHRRFDLLVKEVENGVLYHSSKMVGQVYDVLVDGPSKKDKDVLSGYTETSKLVNFKGPSYLKGHIVKVKIIENHAFSLIGELVDDPLIALVKDVKDIVDLEDSVINFKQMKKAYEEDKTLQGLLDDIETLKNEIKKEGVDDLTRQKSKALLKEKVSLLKESPTFNNLHSSIDEVNDLFAEIMEILK